MQCRYLTGENIAPKTIAEARALIGKRVQYLRSSDIDRSGRGYYFPRIGEVCGARGRNIAIDDEHNYIALTQLVEMVLLPEEPAGE